MIRLDEIGLDLTDEQKVKILEWYANKIWVGLEEGSEEPEYHCKSYDPLEISLKDRIAYSYVFDFEDGGRHHKFKDLRHLEKMLDQELIVRIRRIVDENKCDCKNQKPKQDKNSRKNKSIIHPTFSKILNSIDSLTISNEGDKE